MNRRTSGRRRCRGPSVVAPQAPSRRQGLDCELSPVQYRATGRWVAPLDWSLPPAISPGSARRRGTARRRDDGDSRFTVARMVLSRRLMTCSTVTPPACSTSAAPSQDLRRMGPDFCHSDRAVLTLRLERFSGTHSMSVIVCRPYDDLATELLVRASQVLEDDLRSSSSAGGPSRRAARAALSQRRWPRQVDPGGLSTASRDRACGRSRQESPTCISPSLSPACGWSGGAEQRRSVRRTGSAHTSVEPAAPAPIPAARDEGSLKSGPT